MTSIIRKKKGRWESPSPLKKLKVFSYISVNVTAPVEHTLVQVWQPSQRSACSAKAFPSFITKTLTGQLFTHSSQPSHFVGSTETRYMLTPPLSH